MAYEWCSVICENRNLEDWESLLLVSLEIGFRHLDPWDRYNGAELTHTEHHRELVDVVFKSKESEAIADLLDAWTSEGPFHEPPYNLLSICVNHLVGLHHLVPFSSRLRQLVIRSIEVICYKGFEGVGVKRFIELLDHLHVTVKDMYEGPEWMKLLLDTLQSSEGVQHLSHWYWELLVELTVLHSLWLSHDTAYNPEITTFLTEAQEWNRLECWMGIVWIMWRTGVDGITEEELHHQTLLLFRQRPGATQKFEQWMERLGRGVPGLFRRICKQAHEAAQRDATRVFLRIPYILRILHLFRLVLGRFYPPIKELKEPLIHHPPSLLDCLEANSGSRCRIMSPDVRAVRLFVDIYSLSIPPSYKLLFYRVHFLLRWLFLNQVYDALLRCILHIWDARHRTW